MCSCCKPQNRTNAKPGTTSGTPEKQDPGVLGAPANPQLYAHEHFQIWERFFRDSSAELDFRLAHCPRLRS